MKTTKMLDPIPPGEILMEEFMRPLGLRRRNSGENCSPRPMLSGFTVNGRPSSSSAIEIFQPFGVGQ